MKDPHDCWMEEKGAGPGGWATVLDVSFLLEAFVSLPTRLVMVKRSIRILKRFHWLNSVKSIRDSLSRGGMKAEEDMPRCLAQVPGGRKHGHLFGGNGVVL